MKGIAASATLMMLVGTPYCLAQQRIDSTNDVTLDAKIAPKRNLGVLPTSMDELEINIYVDEREKDFIAVIYECEFFGEDGQPRGAMPMGSMSRIAFKRLADGRLGAKYSSTLPSAGRAAIRCRVRGLVR